MAKRSEGIAFGVLVASGIITLILAGCGSNPGPEGADMTATAEYVGVVSYAAEVQPILSQQCGPCHTTEQQGGLSLMSYEDVTTTGEHAPIVQPGRPETSLLMVAMRSSLMPHEGVALSDEDIQIVEDWILLGAPDN